MASMALKRKITKGRVVRTPDGFEVGEAVHFVAISPRTSIMTSEPPDEAQRIVDSLPAPKAAPWADAMLRVAGVAHTSGRRQRAAGPVEAESSVSDADAIAFATVVKPKRRARNALAVVR